MKKILFFMLVICVIALISICGCSKKSSPTSSGPAATNTPTPNSSQATATAVASGYGTISGTITLPNTSKSGVEYMIIVCTDLFNFATINNNGVNSYQGTVGSTTSIPYSLTATAGTSYYVVMVTVSGNGPGLGDFCGVYGAVFPAYPTSANVAVTRNTTTSNINITEGTILQSVSGTLTLPASVSTTYNYDVMITQNPPSPTFVDGNNNFGSNSPGEYQGSISSGTTCSYTIPLILPGNYYVEAFVDVGNNGTISTGDYTGATASISINPANNYTNENITLTTQP